LGIYYQWALIKLFMMQSVVGQLLYTGATIKHCQMFMVRRQTRQLEMAKKWLTKKKMDTQQLAESIMEIRQIDPC